MSSPIDSQKRVDGGREGGSVGGVGDGMEHREEGVLLTRVKDLPLIPQQRRAAATSARQTCSEGSREGWGKRGMCSSPCFKVPLAESPKREDLRLRTRFFAVIHESEAIFSTG